MQKQFWILLLCVCIHSNSSWTATTTMTRRVNTLRYQQPSHSSIQHERQYYPRTQSATVLHMAKDGKKKRKKGDDSSSSSASMSSSSSTQASSSTSNSPARVSTNINVPIRRQLRWAEFNKQMRKQESNPTAFRQKKVERTSYRKTWDEEEIEEKAEMRKRKGQDPDWEVILNQTQVSPLVIVDGYNIIHKWPRLKKHITKGDLQRARQLLIDDLENMRVVKGWRIECVFDGAKRSVSSTILGRSNGQSGSISTISSSTTSGGKKTAYKDVSKFGVRIVFTGAGVEADTYIEERCQRAKDVTNGRLTSSFIVATDDTVLRLAGQNAGAMCMGAERFVDELKSLRQAVEYQVEAAVAKVNGHAIRPAQLRGTHIHMGRFGRHSVLIEDKRNRTKAIVAKNEESAATNSDNVKIDTQVQDQDNEIPWWAQVPNHTVIKGNSRY